MFVISKTFEFSASHQLNHLVKEDHPCKRCHGHNYVVTVVLKGEKLDENGFIQDYRDLSPIKQWIDESLDHRHLNDVLGNPLLTTAENLAKHIFNVWRPLYPNLSEVWVSETPKTLAKYIV